MSRLHTPQPGAMDIGHGPEFQPGGKPTRFEQSSERDYPVTAGARSKRMGGVPNGQNVRGGEDQ